jgi:hypothetical protein
MTFDELVKRMLNDRSFREAVAKDPSAALKTAGVTATPEMVSALKGVNPASIRKVAVAFGSKDGCEGGLFST